MQTEFVGPKEETEVTIENSQIQCQTSMSELQIYINP